MRFGSTLPSRLWGFFLVLPLSFCICPESIVSTIIIRCYNETSNAADSHSNLSSDKSQ